MVIRPLAAALAALALVPAAAAAQAPPPDEHAAAQAYADAAGRLTDAVEAPANRLLALFEHPLRRAPGCPKIARRHRSGAVVISFYHHTLEFARDVSTAMRAMRSELANVATADPVLISGRAAWRAEGRSLERLPEPGDLCAELASWRRAGYPEATVRRTLRDFESLDEVEGTVRKLRAAVERMVELGVPREQAELFADPYRESESWDGS